MLNGVSNAEKIWNFLKNKGFNDYACSGILSSMDCESGLRADNMQDSYEGRYTDYSYVKAIDIGEYTRAQFINDSIGFGICQWTWSTRKASLYDFAKEIGKSISDLEMQLEFFYRELSQTFPSILKILINASSVQEASDCMLFKYECPNNAQLLQPKRLGVGYKYYTQFVTNTSTNKEGEEVMEYKYFTKGQAVKVSAHFYSTEFDCHGSGCCTQTIINEDLFDILERIRSHFNAPITITSPYRCQIHNSRIGGAPGSRHSRGDACDIVVKGVSPRKVAQYAESIGILGIGLYETAADGYFVHIDTRNYKSFWYGQNERPITTFGVYTGNSSTGNVNNNIQNTSNLDTILNIGDTGSSVKTMQEKLIKLGYSCGDYGADGDFGNGTYRAVIKFQKNNGLGVDGIAGHQTLTAIDNAIKELDDKSNSGDMSNCEVKVTASLLNVRAGAGTSYPIIATIRKNSICQLEKERDGWGKISNPPGWISKDYYEKI